MFLLNLKKAKCSFNLQESSSSIMDLSHNCRSTSACYIKTFTYFYIYIRDLTITYHHYRASYGVVQPGGSHFSPHGIWYPPSRIAVKKRFGISVYIFYRRHVVCVEITSIALPTGNKVRSHHNRMVHAYLCITKMSDRSCPGRLQ